MNQDLKIDNKKIMDLTHPQYPPPLSKINISQAKPEPRDLTQA